jgi:hypothetical protein
LRRRLESQYAGIEPQIAGEGQDRSGECAVIVFSREELEWVAQEDLLGCALTGEARDPLLRQAFADLVPAQAERG